MNKAARRTLGIVGVVLAVFLGPWVLVCGVFVAEDIKNDLALRRYQPTSLADAVKWKYATPAIVARFIDAGADVNQKVGAEPGISLIAEAAARDNVEVARLLLHRGARIEEAGLWDRARNGQEAMARMLVEEGASLGRQPRYEEGIGPELLQAAAFGGQAWLVELILQNGADVQVVNAGGSGLLALALSSDYHDSLSTTKALLAAGAHVNPATPEETPPLYWAAYNGKVAELDLLLAAGAGVDAPFARGLLRDLVLPPGVQFTPLSAAVERCHYDVAERLLRHGASKSTAVISDGVSLMEGACYRVLDNEKEKRERMRALLER